MNPQRSILGSLGLGLRAAALLVALGQLVGCEVDSFFNPSIIGYWENQPTTIPILERLDAIEEKDSYWGQTTEVTPEDLIPSDLSYRMIPGDYVTVSIFELFAPGQWATSTRRIDAGGFLRVQEVGDVPAAGMTAQEFQDVLTDIVDRTIITNPLVEVAVEEGGGLRYTLYGATPAPGMFTLRNPDLRLLDALAIAGGIPIQVKTIYVVRQVELTEEVKPSFERGRVEEPPATEEAEPKAPVDIEDLIEQLDDKGAGGPSPGVLRQQDEPAIDIDELEPPEVGKPPMVDIDELPAVRPDAESIRGPGTWVYIEERGEWVRVPGDQAPEAAGSAAPGAPPMYVERIIKIPADRLARGESKYNIVVRPNDRIYMEPPAQGFVYVDGQINRPGVYGLPAVGELTLDRLVAAAGGVNTIAIPERVDLIRRVGENREAAIRLNLAAIRHRTEPDVLLKPDDHIIIGTSWVATPLAIIRNDVFGAPPVNYRR
jgi:polysaccharide export outer membrane protein